MRIVRPDGSIMKVSDRQDLDLLHATQVNIGMFGVVSEITLQVTDAFWLHDRVWREDFDALMEQYDAGRDAPAFRFLLVPDVGQPRSLLPPDTTKVSNSKKDYDVCEIKVMDITDARTFHEGEHEKIAYSPRCTRSTTCRTSTSSSTRCPPNTARKHCAACAS